MQSSKDQFIQFQEAEYFESEVYKLKEHLTLPVTAKCKVVKTKKHGNSKVQN